MSYSLTIRHIQLWSRHCASFLLLLQFTERQHSGLNIRKHTTVRQFAHRTREVAPYRNHIMMSMKPDRESATLATLRRRLECGNAQQRRWIADSVECRCRWRRDKCQIVTMRHCISTAAVYGRVRYEYAQTCLFEVGYGSFAHIAPLHIAIYTNKHTYHASGKLMLEPKTIPTSCLVGTDCWAKRRKKYKIKKDIVKSLTFKTKRNEKEII